MLATKVPFNETNSFSSFFIDYSEQSEALRRFYHRSPHPLSFAGQITDKAKSFSTQQRNALVSSLIRQYTHLPSSRALEQIQRLNESDTFTVVTGHQLNICTGPLYFIYKIITVINTCKRLCEEYPDKHFVPVYWMASEDHDYDEIKSFRVFGKKYVWQTDQQGAVGRFSTQGLPELLDQVPGSSIFKVAYQNNRNLADAVRQYVDELFGAYGVVVIDGDDPQLKSLFVDVIKDDLINHTAKKLVDETNDQLEALGYKTQVYCREINLFYLDENIRSRIERDADRYIVLDSPLSFSETELLKAVNSHPENFSPNVILRPLYQETILPNVAYCGGPAEIVYWLQLKNVFDHYQVPYPILIPRNFALIMEAPVSKKFDKTGLSIQEIFLGKDELSKTWVRKNSHHDLSVDNERKEIKDYFQKLKEKAGLIDQTLNPFTAALEKRAANDLDRLEKKMMRAEKRRQGEKLGQIEAVKDYLFPRESPQERIDNVLNFFTSDPEFIPHVMANFDPFDFRFNVLRYGGDEESTRRS